MADTEASVTGRRDLSLARDRSASKPSLDSALVREANDLAGERIIAFRQSFVAEVEADLARKSE